MLKSLNGTKVLRVFCEAKFKKEVMKKPPFCDVMDVTQHATPTSMLILFKLFPTNLELLKSK